MNVIPLHLQRKVEQRWAARFLAPAASAMLKVNQLRGAHNTLPRTVKAKRKNCRVEQAGSMRLAGPMRGLEMKQILGLSLALLLLGGGIWANVGGGSLSQNKGAWVSYAFR